jgi:hypothetical protein
MHSVNRKQNFWTVTVTVVVVVVMKNAINDALKVTESQVSVSWSKNYATDSYPLRST